MRLAKINALRDIIELREFLAEGVKGTGGKTLHAK